MFAGLQELGVANGEDLKETLTNCTEPLKAIEQFQVGSAARGAGAGAAGATTPGGGHPRLGAPRGWRCSAPAAVGWPELSVGPAGSQAASRPGGVVQGRLRGTRSPGSGSVFSPSPVASARRPV